MKTLTRDLLVTRRAIIIADAQMKLDCGDYHGCADACMDLREIEAQIVLFDQIREAARENRTLEVGFLEAFGAKALG